MKAGRVWGGALACLALAASAWPAAAAAKPGYEVEHPGFAAAIALQGSNGFEISVKTAGRRQVVVETGKGSVFATYAVPGRVTPRRIEADLGELGRISVRFERVRKRLPEDFLSIRKCRGPAPIEEVGQFVGDIQFDGEQGYTQVRTSRIAGSVTRSRRRVCERLTLPPVHAPAQPEERIPVTVVGAASKAPGRSINLEAFTVEGSGRGPASGLFLGFVSAVANEHQADVAITRTALASFGRLAIALGDRGKEPRSATVALPKPFSGNAAYAKEPGAPASWTGSLAVWLPGLGTVPLTGPDFEARVCHSTDFKLLRNCEDPKAKENIPPPGLPMFQGSGSQSQELLELRLSSSR